MDALKHPYFSESNLTFTQPSEIRLNKGTEKKKKNDNFLFRRGGNLILGDKKNNLYSWTKAMDGQNKDVDNNGPASYLPPLDIEVANNFGQKEFVLPTIKAVSPFESQDSFRDMIESIEQSIIKNHQVREHETIIEKHEQEENKILSINRPHMAHCNESVEQFLEGRHFIENSIMRRSKHGRSPC